MARVVLLLTNVFPFAKGEEFLETEIGHLAAGFDRVVIVATQTTPDSPRTREVPANCVVVQAGGPRPGGRRALATIARGMTRLVHPGHGTRPVHPGKLAAEALFEGRARAAMTELAPKLDRFGLGPDDQVVIYSYWFHVTARVGMLAAQHLRGRGVEVLKLVSRAHRYDLYPEESPFIHLPQRHQLLAAYDEVHPVSDHGTAMLRRAHPRYAPKVTTRRLGTRDPGEAVVCRQHPARVVSCSWMLPVKRVDRFPGILAEAEQAGVSVDWTHIGTGELGEQVQAEADRLLGPGRAELAGYVPNAELPERYRALQPLAFVNVSESEGVPVSIMESIALGMPVVATDVGGVAEIVHDGLNGSLLAKDFTDEQAAAALVRLASAEPEQYRAWCRASRQIWEQNFNEAVVYPAFAAELARPPMRSGRPLSTPGD